MAIDDRPCVMNPEDDCSVWLPCAECPGPVVNAMDLVAAAALVVGGGKTDAHE